MWIKVRTELRHSPKMATVALRLGVTPVTALGAIVNAWMIADAHADENGFIEHLSFESFNFQIGVENLGQAMEEVGWLKEVKGGIKFVDYLEHNGSTAKDRAQSQKRNAKKRKSDVTQKRNRSVTRGEEKRIEENRREEEVDGGTTSPSLQQAISFANEKFPLKTKLRPILGQTDELTEKWHSDREAEGWLTKFGNPIKSWRADLENYADRWAKWEEKNKPGKTKENYLQKLN